VKDDATWTPPAIEKGFGFLPEAMPLVKHEPCPALGASTIQIVSVGFDLSRSLPVCPGERTSSGRPGMSQSCHKRSFSALPSYASLHRRALHIGPHDERAAVRLSEVGDGHVEIEQAEMTDDKLSDARLLRYAAHDRRCCV
jgi:hypothetical protein